MSKALSLSLALLGLGVLPLNAQQVPTLPLGTPTARVEEPYTLITGVRELPSGKALVIDQRDRVVQLVELQSGRVTKVGREGSGPGEYRSPGAIYPLPNDETLLVDPSQRRFLRLDVTGKVLETLSYPEGLAQGMRARGTDSQGRVYFEGPALGMPNGGPDGGIVTPDSLPVVRWDRRSGKIDTLLMVKGPQMKVTMSGEGNNRNFGVRQQPYGSRDGWSVGSDGRVVVARSNPYRVDTRAPSGVRSSGPVISSQPLPLTQADKELFLKSLQTERRSMSVAGDGRGVGTSSASGPAPPPPSADEFDWPATKSFFDAASVQVSPAGELWVERTRVAGDEVRVYDVVGADGRLVRRVTFPARTRLVGFGAGTLYAARSDEDDLQYLERYRTP